MGDRTRIEWCDASWNPLRGCTRVSEGCRNCYAEGVAARFSGPGLPYEGLAKSTNKGPRWTGTIQFVETVLVQPIRWRRPRMIFVNSMSDLFHEDVPDVWIDRIFAVMSGCSQHTFQVLTKRPERMRKYLSSPDLLRRLQILVGVWINPSLSSQLTLPLRNVWVGVSVEDQKCAEERIPLLLDTPAAVRFLSCEPLLGPLDLRSLCYKTGDQLPQAFRVNSERCSLNALTGTTTWPGCHYQSTTIPARHTISDGALWTSEGESRRLDWVIVGGESGPDARPMHPTWVRALRDQCTGAGVAFFFKQWGEHHPHSMPHWKVKGTWVARDGGPCSQVHPRPLGAEFMERIGKSRAGRRLDGRTWDQVPSSVAISGGQHA